MDRERYPSKIFQKIFETKEKNKSASHLPELTSGQILLYW